MSGVEPVTEVSGTAIPVRGNDVDTDQIIPARYMKVVTFDGLGQFAFNDLRYDDDGEPTDHPFNDERFQGASVLVVNSNFGCGSSREHAPQALMRWGVDAIVGESFAEIFAGNCLALGIPTVTAEREHVTALQDYVDEHPDATVTVDVEGRTVRCDDAAFDATVPDAQYRALVEGEWDTTSLLAANAEAAERVARDLPYVERDR